MTNKLTVESVIEELETLASPIAEVMPDATRLTAFILATNKLRTTLTTLQTQHREEVERETMEAVFKKLQELVPPTPSRRLNH
jgi:hypothetical protein